MINDKNGKTTKNNVSSIFVRYSRFAALIIEGALSNEPDKSRRVVNNIPCITFRSWKLCETCFNEFSSTNAVML